MSKTQVINVIWAFWWVLLFTVLVLFFFQSYDPTVTTIEHTYFQTPTVPATNGVLVSSRWTSVNFWLTMTFTLTWIVPFTAAFMLYSTVMNWRSVSARYFHLVIVILITLFITGILIYYIAVWVGANRVENEGNNIANDYRYCCVFYASVPACTNHPDKPCDGYPGPPLAESELTTNGDFLFRFWFLFGIWVLFIVDLALTALLGSALRKVWDEEDNDDEEEEIDEEMPAYIAPQRQTRYVKSSLGNLRVPLRKYR